MLVIDSTEEQNTTRVRLTAGQRVDLKLQCGFKHGEAAVALSHDTPGLDRRAVLPAYLHPTTSGEKAPLRVVEDSRPQQLAHFDFESLDGVIAHSQTGSEVFGRLIGTADSAPGRVGRGITLTGNGEFAPALFPIDEELRLPNTEYAIAFWFQTKANNIQLCETKRYSSYNNRWSDHVIQIENGKLQFRLKGDDALTSEEQVSDGTWHHVASTVGSGGQQLYLDGKLIGTGKLTRRQTSSNRLGLDVGPGASQGTVSIDELTVLGQVPTLAQIKLFASQVGSTPRPPKK
jgi:hypothetical protein